MFIHQLSRRSTAMTSVLAAASPLLFRVREEPSQPTAVPIAPRQKFEKTFAIDAAPHAKVAPAIERLVVATPGLTYVSFDVNAPPSVKVSSELRETVDVFEVVHADDAALEIRLQDATRLEQQYILTEVSLPSPSALKSLDVRGGGTIVLDDNVLAVADKHADIRIRLFGSGDVFATSHSNIDVKSLSVELSGSGDMQLVAPTITTSDAFSSTISSSGDIRLFTGSIRAPQIQMKTAGSGDMKISSLSIDASSAFTTSVSGSGTIRLVGDDVNAASISASVAGSGDIKFIAKNTFATGKFDASVAGSGDVFVATNSGRCDVGSMSVSGSGKVDARDLVANYAQINVTGSGSTVVRAGEVCTASVVGSGSAKIVGPLPPKTSGRFKSVSVEEKPSLVEKLTAKCGKEWSVPSRADAFEQLTRFNGTLNVRSFSDFITAVKLIWNHRSNDKVVIKAGYHSDD